MEFKGNIKIFPWPKQYPEVILGQKMPCVRTATVFEVSRQVVVDTEERGNPAKF